MPDMNQEQLIFLHIPKTAGTSLNQMLSKAYGVMNPVTGKFIHYNSTLSLIRDARRRERPVILGHIHYEAVKVLSPSRKVITFLRDPVARTISAFEFMKSHPEVWLGKLAQGSITEFLSLPNIAEAFCNSQVRMLGLKLDLLELYADHVTGRLSVEEYFDTIQNLARVPVNMENLEIAKNRLQTLDFVGFTDTFDDDVKKLFALLDKPCSEVARANQTPVQFRKRDKYTEDEIAFVASINSLDSQLYTYAKELRGVILSPI